MAVLVVVPRSTLSDFDPGDELPIASLPPAEVFGRPSCTHHVNARAHTRTHIRSASRHRCLLVDIDLRTNIETCRTGCHVAAAAAAGASLLVARLLASDSLLDACGQFLHSLETCPLADQKWKRNGAYAVGDVAMWRAREPRQTHDEQARYSSQLPRLRVVSSELYFGRAGPPSEEQDKLVFPVSHPLARPSARQLNVT